MMQSRRQEEKHCRRESSGSAAAASHHKASRTREDGASETERDSRTTQGGTGKNQLINSTQVYLTRSQAVARIADHTAKNCRGHVT